VTGTLIFPPGFTVKPEDGLSLGFEPEAEGGKPVGAVVNPADLSFVAKEVLPGKYTLTVFVTPYSNQAGNRAMAIKEFNDAHSKAPTKLTCEVTSDPDQSFTVDIAKGKVTKK
jgi:hypothetical protein